MRESAEGLVQTAPVALPSLAQDAHLPLGFLTSNAEIVPRNQEASFQSNLITDWSWEVCTRMRTA